MRPVAGSSVTAGSLEVVDVIVTSAGSTATPLRVSEARTDDVTPPLTLSIGANVSGRASISGASTVTVTTDVVQLSGFNISPVSYTHLTLPTNREV